MERRFFFNLTITLLCAALLLFNFLAKAQIPKLFIKCVEVENQKQSGYFKIQQTYSTNTDTPNVYIEEGFFIKTPKDFKY